MRKVSKKALLGADNMNIQDEPEEGGLDEDQ